jgi:predicted PurR-regulated permease PerM
LILALVFGLFRQAANFVDELPRYSQQIQREFSPILKRIQAAEGRQSGGPSGKAEIGLNMQNLSSYLENELGSVRELLVIAGVTPFLVFFMLARKEQMYFRVVELLEDSVDARTLVSNVNGVLRGVAYSYLIAGSAMAAVCCGEFAVIRLHGALVLGILCGYVNLIPYVGAILALILALAGAMLQFSRIAPIIAIVLTVLGLHFILANVVAPKWIGLRAQIGPAAVLAGMLFWGWLWGILGIVLAVPLTASLKVAADLHPSLTYFSDLLADNLHLGDRGDKLTPRNCNPDRGNEGASKPSATAG